MENTSFLQKINILRPAIFPFDAISAGITLTNYHLFQNGFSIKSLVNTNQMHNNKQQKHILSNSIGTSIGKLAFQKQIHSNIVQVVDNNNQTEVKESDGMITTQRSIALCISLADCAGVLCYAPKSTAVGAFHSGWRGTKSEIVKKGITMMQDKFNAKPAEMLVYITPSAGKEKYEIEGDVEKFFPKHSKATGNGKYLLDLKAVIVEQLIDIGINRNNIEVSTGCTISDTNYHSFRRDGASAGRMAAFIMMR